MQTAGLSKWFFIGLIATFIGVAMIWKSRKSANKSKALENGYMLFILGLVGVISEFTDFATVLLFFVIISGFILLIDRLVWSKNRADKNLKPHYVFYSREFFPVVLVVWVLRAFLFEAYQIPSSSMRPDLTVGDFILVNKFSYGFRMPISNQVVIPVGKVERGDIVVFEDQEVRNRDLIKRVIGLPGDKIAYIDKKLTINGKPLSYQSDGSYDYNENTPNGNVLIHTNRKIENLTGIEHPIITDDRFPPVISELVKDFPNKANCAYSDEGFECTVPDGEYFMMGDNRDNSLDSRYWGFVPDRSIFGKAIYVWMNFRDLSRIGTKIE